LGLISKSFECKDPDIIVKLYTTLVLPIIKYNNVLLGPTYILDRAVASWQKVVRPYLCVTDKMTEVWISTARTGHAKHAKLGGSGGMPPREIFENLPLSE